MAQPSRSRGKGKLARRLGLDGARGVVAACVVMALGAGGVGAARASADAGVVIERADDGAGQAPAADGAPEPAAVETPMLVVHVDGAVASPGVYEVSGESPRVQDAVEAAGGLLEDADTTGVNLAAPLVDGSKIHIPLAGESAAGEGASGAGSGGSTSASAGLVNINMATEAELCALPGVGEATALAIVRDREANGPFAAPEDIMRVSGIGQKKFERMRDMICV